MGEVGDFSARPSGCRYYDKWTEPLLERSPSPYFSFLSSLPSYQGKARTGDFGIHSQLDSPRVCAGDSQPGPDSLPFFSHVHSSKGYVREETNHRSLSYESPSEKEILQDGRPQDSEQVFVPRVVGSEIGFEGCLSTPSVSSSNNSFLCFRPWETPVRVSENAFRAVPSSVGIYQGSQTSEEVPEVFGSQSVVLSGRLPDLGQIVRGSSERHKAGDIVPTEVGIPYKLEKISSAASEETGISRSDCGFRTHDFFVTKGESRVNSYDLQVPSRSLYPQKRSGVHSGVFELHSRLSPSGEALAEAHSEVGKLSLVSSCKDGGNFLDRRPQTSSSAMDGQVVSFNTSAHCPSISSGSFNDRCLRFGLGSSVSDPSLRKRGGGSRQVASGLEILLHELAGVKSNSSLPPSLPSPDPRSLYLPAVRQYHRTVLHPQAGISGLSGFVGSVPRDFSFLSSSCDHLVSLTSQRDSERPCRQSIQGGTHFYGMGPGRSLIPVSVPEVGLPRHRHHGNLGEFKTLKIHLPLSRLSSLSHGLLLVKRLEQLGFNIHFSSMDGCSDREGSSEISIIPGSGLPNSTPVALQGLVYSPRGPLPNQHQTSLDSTSDPTGFGGRSCLPRGYRFKPSRVETIRDALVWEGFSRRSADFIIGCHKTSTIKQYQSGWTKFLNYLDQESIPHDKVRICHAVNFLSWEQEINERAYNTIANYKAAISLPLKIVLNLDLSSEKVEKLMSGIYNIVSPVKRPMPNWSLSDVLRYLRSDVFYPMESISFDLLSRKLLIIFALASGRRISEIFGCSRETFVLRSRIFIKWIPEFRPKWDSAVCKKGGVDPPSILRFEGGSSRDKRLCPFLTLQAYLKRRGDFCNPVDDNCLWLCKDKGALARLLKNTLFMSRRWCSAGTNIVCYPHQMKKLAVSYTHKYFDKAEKLLPKVVGNFCWGTLKENYLGEVPSLKVACVLPLGTFKPPRV